MHEHEHEHEHSSTTRAREHESTRTRALDHSSALEHESTSTRWPGNQCEPSGERHAKPVGFFFNHVGLRAPGCLYVLGMPPRGYLLPIFATLKPQSTCHGPRPGPTLAPWCSSGLPAFPGAESTRKDTRPEEKKCRWSKVNTFVHGNICRPSVILFSTG